MKTYIAALLFFGVTVFMGNGAKAQYSCDNVAKNHSKVEIVKGFVVDFDKDEVWDMVTFGLDGPDSYLVISVDVVSLDGDFIGRVTSPEPYMKDKASWYMINFAGLKVPTDFNLVVHVRKFKGGKSDLLGAAAAPPNDPEETVLIVKYP